MGKVGVDRFANKHQLDDDRALVQPRKQPSIAELFEADEKKKKEAQKTDVVDDGRGELVADANDDVNEFLRSQGKDDNDSQNPNILFQFSDNANTDVSQFDREQASEQKDDVADNTTKPSTDDRDEYVSEAGPDDLSAFESEQKKTQQVAAQKKECDKCNKAMDDCKCADKSAQLDGEAAPEAGAEAPAEAPAEEAPAVEEAPAEAPAESEGETAPAEGEGEAAPAEAPAEGEGEAAAEGEGEAAAEDDDKSAEAVAKKVKGRWAKLVPAMLFNPFQLEQKKAVAFKVGNDVILMPSKKPTRTEWLTAKNVISEHRDPSVLRSAKLVDRKAMDDEMMMEEEDLLVPDELVMEEENGEAAELDLLTEALAALEEGNVDVAKEKVQEVIAMEEAEVMEEGEGEEVEIEEEIVVEEVPEGIEEEV